MFSFTKGYFVFWQVIDTPGFGDSDGEDEALLDDMMEKLAEIDYANTIVLLLDGSEKRFEQGLQAMLKRITIIFSKKWWDHVVIGVSFWGFDEASIKKRKQKGEAWFRGQINSQICDKLHECNKNFTFVFADSHFDRSDPQQQARWQEETTILWEATTSRGESFSFMTINNILEENTRVKRENQRLTNVIDSSIAQLSANNAELNTEMKQLRQEVDHMHHLLPVGSIIAWVSRPSDNTDRHLAASIPRGWVRCSGTLITEGKWKGYYTPDLNNAKKFLRGGPDHSERQMEDWAMVDHHHNAYADPHTHTYADKHLNTHDRNKATLLCGGSYWGTSDEMKTTRATTVGVHVQGVKNLASKNRNKETRPTNMKVICIMRVF